MTSPAVIPAGTPAADGPGRPPAAVPPRPRGIAERWWFLLVWVAALLIFTSYHRGQIGYDTKLGVDIDPASFLARLWPLWNPLEWFGSLQDQYIGYAIPMAPCYLAGQVAHLPVWLTERVWLSVLVTVAFAGAVRLAAVLRIGSPGSRLLAGAAFALWPAFTIAMGSTSAGALPGIMMPWAVLPLTGALRGTAGIWRAAARSGVAIALMGGVNATSTLAVLVLPAVYILAGTGPARSGRRLRLGAAWSAAVLAATAWWLVPLLLQGRYSFNFLPYIEQSATTSRTMSADAVLRGAGTWTAYLHLAGLPWIQAGWVMVTSPLPVLAASAVTASGLAGLARRDMPERRWLTISVGVVAAITMSAYYGPLSGPLSGQAGRLLDGPLAPLRSTYKFEPVAAAAIALGCAHVLLKMRGRLDGLMRVRRRAGRACAVAGAAVVATVLGGLALPQLTGQMSQDTFTEIPSYWYQASAWLAAHSPQQAALVTPADPHAQFLWGTTDDDPLEPLAGSPWTERGIVPYGGAGSQQLLETIESAIESGTDVPGLPAYLDRAGIRYVVVRNDMSPNMLGYTPPQAANETLAQSGFGRVASFGPLVASAADYPQVPGGVPGFAAAYPAVEIFQAADATMRAAGPVSALNTNSTTLVSGGADSLLQLGAQGVLATGTPAVLAGTVSADGAAAPRTLAVTDGQRRADHEFGATSDYVSYTYTAAGVNPADDPLGGAGQPPRQLLPVPAAGHQTVAVLSGAASVTASSAGSWLSESQQFDPVNAFDGDASTAWAESSPVTPVGQWIQIDFGHPVRLPALAGIRLLDDSPYRAFATELTVTTAQGSAGTVMAASGALQSLRIRPGPSRWLRITITAAANSAPGGPGAGITDVLIPGITVTKYLQPAQDASAPAVVYSFQRQPEESRLARTFTTQAREPLSAGMTALPVAGPGLYALIARLTPAPKGTFQASASSSWSWLPEFGASGAFTGSRPWIAAGGDRDPSITVRWHGMRTIRSFQLAGAYGLAAVPVSVMVSTGRETVLAGVDSSGTVTLPAPVRTSRLTLSFPALTHAVTQGSLWQPERLPVGLSKIVIPGLRGLRLAVPDPGRTFHLACGAGPRVTLDGVAHQTSVAGTVGDLLWLRPVGLRLCGTADQAGLAAGRHYLIAGRSTTFTVATVALRSGAPVPAGQTQRRIRVLNWGPDSRSVRIGPGAQSYVEVHENYNGGWAATLNGQRLRAVVLDGWQQGFVVPAGTGGVVLLSYTPAGIYHGGLIVSGVLLLVLLVLALRRGLPAGDRRDRRAGPAGPDAGRHPRASETIMLKWFLSTQESAQKPFQHDHAEPVGPAAGLRTGPGGPTESGGVLGGSSPPANTALYIPLATVILAAGGAMVVAVPVLAAAGRWRPRWMPYVAAAAMSGAGIAAAATTQPGVLGSGAFSGLAQGLALVALTAALMPFPRRREVAGHADALQRDR